MKRKPDWADKKCLRLSNSAIEIAAALRSSERKGFARAVELLRKRSCSGWGVNDPLDNHIAWLEEQK